MEARKLSNLQLELLKIYSFDPSEEDLTKIKKLLADYFANKLVNRVDRSVQENDIAERDLEKWLNEQA